MSEKVLVVEDQDDTRKLIVATLGLRNFSVEQAADSDTGWSKFLSFQPDLVLLDLRLGREDGMQLARSLRDTSQVPLMIVTGKLDEADRVMGLELAADDYINKPFDIATMRSAVANATSALIVRFCFPFSTALM